MTTQSQIVGDWYDLTETEAQIFGLDSDLKRPLLLAYESYERAIGIIDRRPKVGQSLGQWTEKYGMLEGKFDRYQCARFMAAEHGLDLQQCFRWVMKVEAWKHRNGLSQIAP